MEVLTWGDDRGRFRVCDLGCQPPSGEDGRLGKVKDTPATIRRR